MGEVAGEVVGAELLAGVVAVHFEVAHPAAEDVEVRGGEGGVARGEGGCGLHDEHVATFLDGHLLFKLQLAGFAVEAVGLSVDERVGAAVVRGEVVGPLVGRGEAVDGAHHGLDQFRRVEKEERNGGVGDIDGGGGAVGEVLLADPEEFAVLIDGKLVGGDGLAVCGREEGDIVVAAGLAGIVGHALGPGVALGALGGVSGGGLGDCRLDGLAVLVPERAEGLAEVLERGASVVVG